MRTFMVVAAAAVGACLGGVPVPADAASPKGRLLSGMSWMEAKTALTPDTVVVIPVGAEAKEHGPHLPLNSDFRQAEYFKGRVLAEADVVIAPTMNYSFYPVFVEYPGSTTLSLPVAREVLLDVIRGLAKFGPRRFYVINIGVSTNRPLAEASALLAIEGIALRYIDLMGKPVEELAAPLTTQKEGSHADEIETSIMLAIDASVVDMKKAVVEYMEGAPKRGALSLDPSAPRYNASGVYGDATRATVQKGQAMLDGLTHIMLAEIEFLRRTAPPAPAKLFGRLETPRADPQPKAAPARK